MMARRAGILGPKTLTKRHSTRWGGMAEAELGTDRQQPRWLADGDPRQGRRVAANDGHDTLALQHLRPYLLERSPEILRLGPAGWQKVKDLHRAHGRIKSNSSSPAAAARLSDRDHQP
jgi:hypothetical protein